MAVTGMEYDPSSREVMRAFYKRLFPYKAVYRWLNQGDVPGKLWTHREFAFTIENDVYIRYQSFSTAYDFQKEVLRLLPSRFEIGPQYSAKPRDRKTLPAGALQPERRELVFDIDMTDYDEIRTCCSDKAICARCWGFIAAAVKVLDKALRETFGFRHLLWVYSGRRGIHCWVSDTLAMDLTDDQRRALTLFLEVIKGGKEQIKKVNVRGPGDGDLHPALKEALQTLKFEFSRLILEDQECFQSERGWRTLLELLPADREVKDALRAEWEAEPDAPSMTRWEQLMAHMPKKGTASYRKYKNAIEDVILQYTYPRIDAEVSKHRNHLLKSPFCVHPGTGRVCVPVDPAHAHEFDPATVPSAGQLLSELDAAAETKDEAKEEPDGAVGAGGAGGVGGAVPPASKLASDWAKTSLKPYVDLLEAHARAIAADVDALKRKNGAAVGGGKRVKSEFGEEMKEESTEF